LILREDMEVRLWAIGDGQYGRFGVWGMKFRLWAMGYRR